MTIPNPRSWGPWRLNPHTYVLVTDAPGYPYEVDLELCLTPAQALDGLAQVAGKTWASPDTTASLLRAIDDVLNLQANLCPGGRSYRLTAAKVRALVLRYARANSDIVESNR